MFKDIDMKDYNLDFELQRSYFLYDCLFEEISFLFNSIYGRLASFQLFNNLSSKFENYVSDYRDEIKDKANFQIASLNEHKNYQTSMIVNAIEKLKSRQIYERNEKKKTQLDSLIKAQQGRINKLNGKIEEKLIRINDLSSFTEEYADITAIILDIK